MKPIFNLLIFTIINIAAIQSTKAYNSLPYPIASSIIYDYNKLSTGDKADLTTVEDVKGNKISFKKILKGEKLFLVFLRHAWCPVCNTRTHELIENYDKLKKQGIEVVVIYKSSKKSVLPYVNDHELPYTVIADPDGILYQKYHVENSPEKMKKSLSNKVVQANYKKGLKLFGDKKYEKEAKDEKEAIIPADFLIGQNKKIEKVYYGEHIGDHMPLSNLLKETANPKKKTNNNNVNSSNIRF